ncbi:hypothetical protein EV421DRAFT_1744668 [Armillaria borealis]|uniref:Uncharacterized protein n=1 Tax=Armillaria borealis TaxID=47425 RepID=A0AA39MD84_9AGAR|nr:hypothetical protein EV421DRAFT_1744668 [Armillaria borealis]
MDKGHVMVNGTVNVWIGSVGTQERDGRTKEELVEWAELFGGYHCPGQAGVIRVPLSFLFLYLGYFFIAISHVVGYTQSLEIEFKEKVWESSEPKGSRYSGLNNVDNKSQSSIPDPD